MCGRAAQTRRAVRAAEDLLLGPESSNNTTASASRPSRPQESASSESESLQDNYNMSPGMSCTIFFRDDDNVVREGQKVWGLVPSKGTSSHPLPTGMTIHFEKLMFNARSDTLLEKRSFAPLFGKGRTCILVVDGFHEWKPPALKGSKKQPYFVYRNTENDETRPFLMFAGLWTSVTTGREEDPTLDTFTIITTEACPALEWLHSRMPLTIYDEQLARQWLERPTRQVFQQLDVATAPPDYFQWHAVTTEINSTKYRSPDAIKPLPPPPSVKSFFASVKKNDGESSITEDMPSNSSPTKEMPPKAKPSAASLKRSAPTSTDVASPSKKPKAKASPAKRGSIASFFSPKPKN